MYIMDYFVHQVVPMSAASSASTVESTSSSSPSLSSSFDEDSNKSDSASIDRNSSDGEMLVDAEQDDIFEERTQLCKLCGEDFSLCNHSNSEFNLTSFKHKRQKTETTTAVDASSSVVIVSARVNVRTLLEQYKTGSGRIRPPAHHTAVISQYRKEFQLGEGTYGVVYKARDVNGAAVALKKVRLDHTNEGLPTTTIREIVALKELQHPYIVRLLDTSVVPGSVWLIFEFLEYDLHKFLRQHYAGDARRGVAKRPVPDYVCKAFMYQMLIAVDFMHGRRYLHRDLKPQNILVSAKGVVKVADFGLARLVGCPVQRFTHEIVTLWYRAPEVLLGNMKTYYATGVDVWSLACIMGEMFLLQPLFEGDCEIDQLFQIFMILGTPTNRMWPGIEFFPSYQAIFPKWCESRLQRLLPENMCCDAKDIVTKMLLYNPSQRAQCGQVLTSKYFDDVEQALGMVHSNLW